VHPVPYDAAGAEPGLAHLVRTLFAYLTVILAAAGLTGCGGGNGSSASGSSASSGARSTGTIAQTNALASVKPAVGVRRYVVGGDPWAATAAGGDVWVADHNSGMLIRVDGQTGAVRSRAAVAPKPASAIGAATVGDRVWVGAAAFGKGGNDLAAARSADARTGKLGPLLPGPPRAAFAFGAGDGAAFVGGFGYLSRIPFDGSRSTTVQLGQGRVRAIGVVGTMVRVGVHDSTQGTDSIVTFDARSLRRAASVPAAGPVTSITSAAGAVWVASATQAGDSVVRLDPQSGRKLAGIDGGTTPTAIAADASGVWVLDYFASTVRHISSASNSVDEALKFAPAASNDLLPDNSPDGLAILPGAVWVTVRDAAVAYRIPVTH
jgi:hypothetical protein